ncbi:MAG: acetoacetate--CoA ligase [Acidobacteria bacterium]|nr:acetoacetate--CoA ligase [Acidobacteriota bacterium]
MTESQPMWRPSPSRIADANLTRFLQVVGQPSYEALYRWSVDEPAAFWEALRRFCGVELDTPNRTVVEGLDRMPGTVWFPGAKLNFARHLLRFRDDREALVFWNENGRQSSCTYAELHEQVARFADGLRAEGVAPGDRIAGFLPNRPEAVIAMLAASSLGAVWSSCSPDFGYEGLLDRFGQIEPKVLVTADGYPYNGKSFDSLDKVRRLCRSVDSIQRVVVAPYGPGDPDLGGLPAATLFSEFGRPGHEIPFASLPFDHPLYVLYSSGTTGKPKCIVHGAGGTLLQHLKEHVLHTDLRREDRLFYFTTCGWMMWNWLASGLATGATLVLYDGSPFHPHPAHLWDMAEREGVTVFGTSAKYIAACEKADLAPARTHDLSAVRTILSTGSPLAAESYDYVYRAIRADVQLASISGGTDIVSCFALGNPLAPVWRGEIQTRGLGMKVEVFDDEGSPLPVGHKGELVCSAPFPSMPLGFWDDPDGAKYRAAYFERFPGVWHHGDYCQLTEHGGMIVWGRSDAVLNPGGVRIGTAEIYRAVEALPEIAEACAIGQEWDNDVRIILFVKLRPPTEALDPALDSAIRLAIRAKATPRHTPAKILAVADIPRTRSGKIAEIAVRHVVHGRAVTNREALSNPESLELFRNLPEIQKP